MRLLFFIVVVSLWTGCTEETPSRDHISALKGQVYKLQEAVKSRSRAAIDSLLSTDILEVNQSSDSLLSFCWGDDKSFPFDRLGNCEIVYTDQHALADCYVMDSTAAKDFPIRLTWVYQHDLWLLQKFETRDAGDSL